MLEKQNGRRFSSTRFSKQAAARFGINKAVSLGPKAKNGNEPDVLDKDSLVSEKVHGTR